MCLIRLQVNYFRKNNIKLNDPNITRCISLLYRVVQYKHIFQYAKILQIDNNNNQSLLKKKQKPYKLFMNLCL